MLLTVRTINKVSGNTQIPLKNKYTQSKIKSSSQIIPQVKTKAHLNVINGQSNF